MTQNPYQTPATTNDQRRMMICQDCRIEAPTKYVEFYQNIGALVMRFHKSIRGNLCKSCVHRRFWEYTGITLLLGWWGTISFFITPFFILNNLGRYVVCLFMPPVPVGAAPPQLTDAAIERLRPHTDTIISRLNSGETLDFVAHDMAQRSGTTPGQVILYIRALIAASKQQR